MLPFWNGNGLASPKYGNIATEKLVEKMLRNGASIQHMVAKVFGGANQMNTSLRIGDQNIEVARQTLANYGIKIIAENVGGMIGRKLRYNTGTGQVMMKFLTKSEGKNE
jgi:chemotaxis protein CheD